jgi:hypothetical protein
VTQHQDLDVLGGVGAGEQRQPAQHAGEHQDTVGRPQLAIMLRWYWTAMVRSVSRE